MHKYRLVSKKGEGTFSEVLKAQSIKTGRHVAIKCMKNHFDSIDQVNNLREIQALRRLAGHPNIIKLNEVLYDEPTGRLALVFELMEMNFYEAIKGRRHYLPEAKVRYYMYEMLKALDHMHRNGIFHRDVKPENLLLLDDEVKLADLGSCRGIYSRQPFTEYISTRWYRAPECLLTDGYYNFKMDLFAAGCVCFELVALFPLFPGQNETDQIQKIHNVLGTPSPELLARKFKRNASHMDFNFPEKKGTGIERLIPHADPELTELMRKLLRYDPDERILARQALKDPYFRDLRDAEKEYMTSTSQSFSRRGAEGHGGDAGGSTQSSFRSKPHATGGLTKASLSGMSGGTSVIPADVDHSDGADMSQEAPGGAAASSSAAGSQAAQATASNVDERTGGLPNIKPGRKAGGGNRSENESENESAHEDGGMVLPPIGGLKGKRDSKAKSQTFKTAGNASLQKAAISTNGVSMHGAVGNSRNAQAAQTMGGMRSNSKGFSGPKGTIGASSMSSTSPHGWTSSQDKGHMRGSSGSSTGMSVTEKMNSTWAPNHSHQSRKSTFGVKAQPSAKKR
jgi:renal tumor antigen